MLSHSVMSNSLQPHGLQPVRLLCPWGFSRQEYWSGLSCPPPGDLPDPGIKPRSPALKVVSLLSEPPGNPRASSKLKGLSEAAATTAKPLQSCPTLCNPVDCSPPGSSVHGDPPGKNTGVVCHALLQGILPTQGSDSGLLHCRRILHHLSHELHGRSCQRTQRQPFYVHSAFEANWKGEKTSTSECLMSCLKIKK